MPAILTVQDQTSLGRNPNAYSFLLSFASETITVRELIRTRVYQEVQVYNARQDGLYRGLVQPTDTEATLNGYQFRTRRPINWERQFEKAIEAYNSNGFIILVDDRQVGELDEIIELKPETSVTFLKIVPLVGG